jgi:hypothetical protein
LRIHPRKTKPRHPLPGAERRLALAEDRAAARSCTDDLTFRSQRQRLSFLRRGVTPRPTSLESTYFQELMGPGRPFRLAKLTACRKVRGMYRRRRPKSTPSHADMGIKARWRKHFRLSLTIARSPCKRGRVREGELLRFRPRAPRYGGFKPAVARSASEGGFARNDNLGYRKWR